MAEIICISEGVCTGALEGISYRHGRRIRREDEDATAMDLTVCGVGWDQERSVRPSAHMPHEAPFSAVTGSSCEPLP